MKTVFDKGTREELVQRINMVDESAKPLWGKMNVYQMLRHCVLFEEMMHGKTIYRRVFLGRIFGRAGLKNMLKDEPMKRNEHTGAAFKIKETAGDIQAEKQKWITLIEAYGHFANEGFVHSFFGKMSNEQVGYFAYKHTDHHLRQFNC